MRMRRTPFQPAACADRALRDGRGRLQVPFHGQGRRFREQVVPVPGDAEGGAEPDRGWPPSSRRRSAASGRPPARLTTWRSWSARTSAEIALKTAKYASARYLDTLPTGGSPLAHGFRDLELEQKVLEITRRTGIGAQFGGKYFCHDVRVIRPPRARGVLPRWRSPCRALRTGRPPGKITAEGVFLEQLETDPARYMPDPASITSDTAEVVSVDLNRPMSEIQAELTKYPVKTRLSLTGTVIVARDIAHAKIAEAADAAASRCPSICAITPSTTLARRSDAMKATRRGHSARQPRAGWTRTWSGSRPPVGRWLCLPRGTPFSGRYRGVQASRRLLPRLDRRRCRTARAGLHYQG